MEINGNTTRLRIYFSSTDKAGHQLLYEHLVMVARNQGISGATVMRGMMGYGASSVIHSYKFWEVSEKVPVVLEIIDDDTKITSYLESVSPLLESMRYGCLVTREPVQVIMVKAGVKKFRE